MDQTRILLRQNLAIEPDVQNFIGFILQAVTRLGGSSLVAVVSILSLVRQLRLAGAGTGYPLPVALLLEGLQLKAEWDEDLSATVYRFDTAPLPQIVESLQQFFECSTASNDPALLLKRNAEMTRYLDETRKRTESEIVSMQRTLAQRQAELHDSIREAETDPLTGLYNRRAYDEKLSQAFNRTNRQHAEAMSLILFDLDFFKEINDRFGHPFGDTHLQKMAQAMRDVIRSEVDFAFRFGGDEFAIVLMADKTIARDKAMQVLVAMNGKVSAGIATISPNEPCRGDLEYFIRRVDEALYQAKGNGKGRIVVDTCRGKGGVTWEQFLPQPMSVAACA